MNHLVARCALAVMILCAGAVEAQTSSVSLLQKRDGDKPLVRLTESARDESAGGLDCYKIETPSATYYLDKVGAGLSSMIDRDGNDLVDHFGQRRAVAAVVQS